jgi:hypothetical protein
MTTFRHTLFWANLYIKISIENVGPMAYTDTSIVCRKNLPKNFPEAWVRGLK